MNQGRTACHQMDPGTSAHLAGQNLLIRSPSTDIVKFKYF